VKETSIINIKTVTTCDVLPGATIGEAMSDVWNYLSDQPGPMTFKFVFNGRLVTIEKGAGE
jgi:hypothetical protein